MAVQQLGLAAGTAAANLIGEAMQLTRSLKGAWFNP
jgi:hypothetical protein